MLLGSVILSILTLIIVAVVYIVRYQIGNEEIEHDETDVQEFESRGETLPDDSEIDDSGEGKKKPPTGQIASNDNIDSSGPTRTEVDRTNDY